MTLAYIEREWLAEVGSTTLYGYEFAADFFEDIGDAGMWVARREVTPVAMQTLDNLPAALAETEVLLRVVDTSRLCAKCGTARYMRAVSVCGIQKAGTHRPDDKRLSNCRYALSMSFFSHKWLKKLMDKAYADLH
jgi:hypothetical protein